MNFWQRIYTLWKLCAKYSFDIELRTFAPLLFWNFLSSSAVVVKHFMVWVAELLHSNTHRTHLIFHLQISRIWKESLKKCNFQIKTFTNMWLGFSMCYWKRRLPEVFGDFIVIVKIYYNLWKNIKIYIYIFT